MEIEVYSVECEHGISWYWAYGDRRDVGPFDTYDEAYQDARIVRDSSETGVCAKSNCF